MAGRDGQDTPVSRGRVRRTMPLAGFTARTAGGRMVAALRAKTGDAGSAAWRDTPRNRPVVFH